MLIWVILIASLNCSATLQRELPSHYISPSICPLCYKDSETLQHHFFECICLRWSCIYIYFLFVCAAWESSYYDYNWKSEFHCYVAGGMQRSGYESKTRLGQEINYGKFFFCHSKIPLFLLIDTKLVLNFSMIIEFLPFYFFIKETIIYFFWIKINNIFNKEKFFVLVFLTTFYE